MMISREALQEQIMKAKKRMAELPIWKKIMLQRANDMEISLGIIPNIQDKIISKEFHMK